MSLDLGIGDLVCTNDCMIDTSGCTFCGNGMINAGEDCDGADLDGHDCVTEGFGGGTISCNGDCTLNTTMCDPCGNGMIDAGETCDGIALGGETCATAGAAMGYDDGELGCAADCMAFDFSMCTNCGDGIREGDEECDGTDFGGDDCEDAVGPGSTGTLNCTPTCTVDDSECCLPMGGDCDNDGECCSGNCPGGTTCQPM